MKHKKIVYFLLCISSFFVFFFPQHTIYGDSETQSSSAKQELAVSELQFDPTTLILTGKTVPYANIYMQSIITNVTADEQGNFSIQIPEGLKEDTIEIFDYIENQSTYFVFDFSKGSLASSESESSSSNSNESNSSTEGIQKSSSQKESLTEKNEDSPSKETKTKASKSKTFLFFIIGILLLIIICVGLLLTHQKKGQQKHRRKNMRRKQKKSIPRKRP